MTLTLLYISLTGNTQHFVTKLTDYLSSQHELEATSLNVKSLKGEIFPLEAPVIAFLPTYLEGGNGVDTGDVEILTTPLGDFLAAYDNYKHCLGIVGSGNRNFNHQYCLTAKQYSQRFGFPLLDNFELRGLPDDIVRIGDLISDLLNQEAKKQGSFNKNHHN